MCVCVCVYVCVFLLAFKIIESFKCILKGQKRCYKILVDKGTEFYNASMKSWFQNNDTEMCSTYNKSKSVLFERLIRALENKIYKYLI